LNKTAQSSLLAVSLAKSEINSNRPVLLGIASNYQYNDHAVTAFAWKIYMCYNTSDPDANMSMTFFRIRDGWSTATRYVCTDEVTGLFTTRVY